MEQSESIPFSSLIAGLLLIKDRVSSVEIVNVISRLMDKGIVIDDENDDIDCLLLCVMIDRKYCFSLRDGFSYETMLTSNINVETFLKSHTNEEILSFLKNDVFYQEFYSKRFLVPVHNVNHDPMLKVVQNKDFRLAFMDKVKRKVREKKDFGKNRKISIVS